LVLHADAQVPGSFLSVRTPPALTSLPGPGLATDLFDISAAHNVSWFASKDCTFYHTKEEPISPIRQDSDSEETISSSESQRHSPHGNSFCSIARDASFLELYTEVLDALTPPKTCETVCEVLRRDAYLGLLRTYICEVRSGTENIELKAQRQLSLGSVYNICKGHEKVAIIKQVSPGVFSIRTSETCIKVSFRAKEIHGSLHRLAEVQMPTSHLVSPTCNTERQTYSSQKVRFCSRNFQLTHDSKVVFQLGKVANRRFDLRFQRPLDLVLSFSLAVCSLVQSNH